MATSCNGEPPVSAGESPERVWEPQGETPFKEKSLQAEGYGENVPNDAPKGLKSSSPWLKETFAHTLRFRNPRSCPNDPKLDMETPLRPHETHISVFCMCFCVLFCIRAAGGPWGRG